MWRGPEGVDPSKHKGKSHGPGGSKKEGKLRNACISEGKRANFISRLPGIDRGISDNKAYVYWTRGEGQRKPPHQGVLAPPGVGQATGQNQALALKRRTGGSCEEGDQGRAGQAY